MDQSTINNASPQSGSATISDQAGSKNPILNPAKDSNSFIAKPVQSTFQSACDSKKEIKIIKSEDGSRTLLLHSFCIKDATANFDQTTQKMQFKGRAEFDGYRNLKSFDFDVLGTIYNGRGLLRAMKEKDSSAKQDSQDPKVMGAAFCNDQRNADIEQAKSKGFQCGSFFIDLYIMVPGFETELFDEQVEDCGQGQCLLISESGAQSPKSTGSKKDIDKDPKTDSKAESKKDKSAPDAAPVKAPEGDAPATPLAPTGDLDPQGSLPLPSDLEINLDNSEEEVAEIPDAHNRYVGLNTPNKINSLFDKIKLAQDLAQEEEEDPEPVAPVVNPKPQPDLAEAPKPAPKPEQKPDPKAKPVKPKPEAPSDPKAPKPKPTTKPDSKPEADPKTSGSTSADKENQTIVPDPIDPAIARLEFPSNISVPLRGPMQVHVLKWPKGYLVNGSELKEPGADKPATFILDRTTKNLSNSKYRKTFGAFYVVEFLEKLADFTFSVLKTPIRINDISLEHGGHLSPHGGHQFGLEADVDYSLIPKDISHEMTAEQKWLVFQRVGASPLVNFIMINSTTKREVCEIANLRKDYDNNSRLAMQKLLVDKWEKHPTHFHINFVCAHNLYCRQNEAGLQMLYPQNEGECLAAKSRPQLMSSAKK